MRCIMPVVLYTKVDAQSDEPVTNDCRQIIVLRVHLSLQHL